MKDLGISRLRTWVDRHPGRAGTLAGWYQQTASVSMALLVIPQVVTELSRVDAGIWFTFQVFFNAIMYLNFGTATAISRQVAYSRRENAAKQIDDTTDFVATRGGWEAVSDLYNHSLTIFRFLASIAVAVLIGLQQFVFSSGNLLPGDDPAHTTAWYLLGSATVLIIYTERKRVILEGLGRIYLNQFAAGTHLLVSGLCTYLAVRLTGSLIAMAIVQLAASLIHVVLVEIFFHRVVQRNLKSDGSENQIPLKSLLKVAYPFGIMQTGVFLSVHVQVPLIGLILGPAAVAPYYIAQKIASTLQTTAHQLQQPQFPYFTSEIATGNWRNARARLLRIAVSITALTFLLQALFFTGSSAFVDLWIGSGQYVDKLILFVMSLNYFLAGSTGTWRAFTISAGRNPFVTVTLITGCLNLTLCIFLVPVYGLLGIVLSSIFAGILTVYWHNILHGFRLWRFLTARAE